jgi:hypothetical protein
MVQLLIMIRFHNAFGHTWAINTPMAAQQNVAYNYKVSCHTNWMTLLSCNIIILSIDAIIVDFRGALNTPLMFFLTGKSREVVAFHST